MGSETGEQPIRTEKIEDGEPKEKSQPETIRESKFEEEIEEVKPLSVHRSTEITESNQIVSIDIENSKNRTPVPEVYPPEMILKESIESRSFKASESLRNADNLLDQLNSESYSQKQQTHVIKIKDEVNAKFERQLRNLESRMAPSYAERKEKI